MEHWQQYRASSHFLFEFFTPTKKGAASVAVGDAAAASGAGANRAKGAPGAAAGAEAPVAVPQGGVSIP